LIKSPESRMHNWNCFDIIVIKVNESNLLGVDYE